MRRLEDIRVNEIPCSTTFECELTKPNVVAKWFRDANKPIKSDAKYTVESEGPVHRLIVTDVDGEDEGDYFVVARGKKSEAELIVEGMYVYMYRFLCQ